MQVTERIQPQAEFLPAAVRMAEGCNDCSGIDCLRCVRLCRGDGMEFIS